MNDRDWREAARLDRFPPSTIFRPLDAQMGLPDSCRSMNAVGMKDEQQYTVETIRAFLAGTGCKRDWDDFTSCPLRDARMNSIRRRAMAVDLPLDEEGAALLQSLLAEADAAHGA